MEFKFDIFGEIVDGSTIEDDDYTDQYVIFLLKSNIGDLPYTNNGLRPNELIDSIDIVGDSQRYIARCNEVFDNDELLAGKYSAECITHPGGKTIEVIVTNTSTNKILYSNAVGTHTYTAKIMDLAPHRGSARRISPEHNGYVLIPYTSIRVKQLVYVGEFDESRIIKTKVDIKEQFSILDYINSICLTDKYFIHDLKFSKDNSCLVIAENDIYTEATSFTQELTIEYILLDSNEVCTLEYSFPQEIPDMMITTLTNTTIKNTNLKKNEEVLIQIRGF